MFLHNPPPNTKDLGTPLRATTCIALGTAMAVPGSATLGHVTCTVCEAYRHCKLQMFFRSEVVIHKTIAMECREQSSQAARNAGPSGLSEQLTNHLGAYTVAKTSVRRVSQPAWHTPPKSKHPGPPTFLLHILGVCICIHRRQPPKHVGPPTTDPELPAVPKPLVLTMDAHWGSPAKLVSDKLNCHP